MSNENAEQDGLQPQPEQSTFTTTDMGDGRTRLRVQFDITYKGHNGKTPEGESETEPDMTLRLGQLLERHSRGADVPMKTPLYFDTEIPTFNDLTDVDRYQEQLQRRLAEVKKFTKAENQKRKEEEELQKQSQKEATQTQKQTNVEQSN